MITLNAINQMRARRLRRLGQVTGAGAVVTGPAAPTENLARPENDAANNSAGMSTTGDSQKNKLIVGSTELNHDDDRTSDMDDVHHKQKHQKFNVDHENQSNVGEPVSLVKIVGEFVL